MRRLLLLLAFMALIIGQSGPVSGQNQYQVYFSIMGVGGSSNRFSESFSVNPTAPTPWNPDNWDVTVHSRDYDTFWQLDGMWAQHGYDCAPPPAAHWITAYEDVLYNCHNHLMSAINAGGYALVYFTPDHQVDMTHGEAVIRWDMSTGRTSTRDWMDIWISPMRGHSQLAILDWLPDLNGPPPHSVHVELSDIHNSFTAGIFRHFSEQRIQTNQAIGWDSFLTPSATRRDRFEIRLSQNHIRVGMPDYNFYWIDQPISPPLPFKRGVVQFGHHSYNPTKPCNHNGGCGPNTIHWDNVEIDPAMPFIIIPADRRWTAPDQGATVNFAQAAPFQAFLRFSAFGRDMWLSFDAGATWQPAQLVEAQSNNSGVFRAYWTPIPLGTTQVRFAGNGIGSDPWHVRDISIWGDFIPPGGTSGAGPVQPGG